MYQLPSSFMKGENNLILLLIKPKGTVWQMEDVIVEFLFSLFFRKHVQRSLLNNK